MKPFTFEDRKALVDEVCVKIKTLLVEKGEEYASGNIDTLQNFTNRATWMGRTRKEVIFFDLSKHLDCIKEWCINDHILTIEQADNRIIDAIVYLVLLIGVYRQED